MEEDVYTRYHEELKLQNKRGKISETEIITEWSPDEARKRGRLNVTLKDVLQKTLYRRLTKSYGNGWWATTEKKLCHVTEH